MAKRYIRLEYESEKSPVVEEKGISFKQLIVFAVALILIQHAVANGVSNDIIIALILNLLK
nr:hypothetical protein [Clostridium chromiireducens]